MSEAVEKTRERTAGVTIRRLFLCTFFIGCGLAVWRLPWDKSLVSTLCLVFLTATFLGAACGAPFGMWFKGAVVGACIAVVPILVVAIPFLAWIWGGP
jgi:hypothetical protein